MSEPTTFELMRVFMQEHEKRDEDRHAEVIGRLDKINGRLDSHGGRIGKLEVKQAWWAGGAAAMGAWRSAVATA